jgi:hypothetical protein
MSLAEKTGTPEERAEARRLMLDKVRLGDLATADALEEGFGGDGGIHEIVLETSDQRLIRRALEREPFFHLKDARVSP